MASGLVLTFALLGLLPGTDLRAAGFRVIHEHSPGVAPLTPAAGVVSDSSGTLYGTTSQGGLSGLGTVYRVNSDGSGLEVLHTFAGGASDGKTPSASLVLDGSGFLYGTTETGGPLNAGTIFKVRTDGTDFQLLHSFGSYPGDGISPLCALVWDGAGNLFGTTYYGGASNGGAVFKVRTDGTGFQVLHSFTGGTGDGAYPRASLVLDGAGNLFGTTTEGGTPGRGTVFRVQADGTGYQLLHAFAGTPVDGRQPYASLVLDAAGNLYGTTLTGGTNNAGAVFTLKADGSGHRLLHSFTGGTGDGGSPESALTLDSAGYLYGTTRYGDMSNGGTVFRVKSDGTGFLLLHTFSFGTGNGRLPYGSLLLDGSGSLYGTTRAGGASNYGTVFKVAVDGTAFQLLRSFGESVQDGSSPYSAPLLDGSGNIYGTTSSGGASDYGTVFRTRTDGTGFQLLYSFHGESGDGSFPYASLLQDASGYLYGTTHAGGTSNLGTVYRLKTDGSGYQLLHSFGGGVSDGSGPYASLILDAAGSLYGTTFAGGSAGTGLGTVFKMKADGTDFQLLHSFAGGPGDGANPRAALVMDGAGRLFGTTSSGGASTSYGTVFSLMADGSEYKVLYSFTWGSQGYEPRASLVLDGSGNLYGTTADGGPSFAGTVFTMKGDGSGFQSLHLFEGGPSDGNAPLASLILDGAGNLFGTTAAGGAWDAGTIFSVKTDGTGYELWHSFAAGPGDGRFPAASLALDGSGILYGTTVAGGPADWGTEFTIDSPCLPPAQPGAFTSSAEAICAPQPDVAYAVPNDPSATYTWSYSGTGATITGSGSSVTVSFSASATGGTLSVRAANACGLSPARTVYVGIGRLVQTPTATNDGPKCEGGTIQLSVGIHLDSTYSWTGPNGFTSSYALATLANVTVAMAGDYWVTETSHGCTSAPAKTTVTVNAVPAAPVVAAPDSVLSSTPGYTASVPSVSGATYAWTISNGTITSGATTSSITFTSGTAGPLKVGATVRNGTGCASVEGTRTVTVLPVGLYTVTPCRAVDTRDVSAPALAAQETRAVLLTGGTCGIPPTAKAVVLNVAAVAPAEAGFLTLFPGDQARPGASSLNFRQGQIKANNAIVPIGADGTLGIFNGSAGTTEVLVDVAGFFQ